MRASAVPVIYCDKLSMVCTSFENFWKVVEIDSAIFQDLESFGKGRFKLDSEEFWMFAWEILRQGSSNFSVLGPHQLFNSRWGRRAQSRSK